MRMLLLLAACLALPVPSRADTGSGEAATEYSVGSNQFTAGSSVEVTRPVSGDSFLAGAEVVVAAPVGGAAFVAGGHVDVHAPITKDLYAAGATVSLASTVGHDARLFGDVVEVAPGATIAGSATLAGRKVTMAGGVQGSLKIAAREALVTGSVAGDVDVSAEHVAVGPEARIGGRLRYRAGHEPQVAPGAQIAGGLELLSRDHGRFGWGDHLRRTAAGSGHGPWFGTGFIVGALLLLLAPAFMTETCRLARRDWVQNLGVGLLVLVMVPIAIVLLFITLIGIPIGLITIALYAALLLLGYVCGATALGDVALERLAPARATAVGWRILALLGALVVLAFLRHVPLLGRLAVCVVLLVGVGALTRRALSWTRPAAGAAAGGAPGAG